MVEKFLKVTEEWTRSSDLTDGEGGKGDCWPYKGYLLPFLPIFFWLVGWNFSGILLGWYFVVGLWALLKGKILFY